MLTLNINSINGDNLIALEPFYIKGFSDATTFFKFFHEYQA